MLDRGFIRVPRSLWDDPYFNEEHEYSKREVWFDLVRLARGVANGIERSQFQMANTILAKRWGWNEHRVRRFLDNRCLAGWLRLVEASDKASHRPAIYTVMYFDEIYNGAKRPKLETPAKMLFDEGCADRTDEGCADHKAAPVVEFTSMATKGAPIEPTKGAPIYKEERTEEENVRERKNGDRGHRTSAPAELPITDAMRAFAKEKGITANLEEETEAMLDHFRGKGETRKDWVATWRTWMRNTKRFGGQRGQRETPEQREAREKETIRRWVARHGPAPAEQDLQTPRRLLPDG